MVLENVKSYVLAYTNDDFLNLDHNVWHQRYPRLALKTNDQLICQKPNIYICEVKQDGNCACYPFDPAFEEVAAAVRNAVVPAAQGRWEKCFYEASDCCSHYMNKEDCATTFDGWTCWLPGELGTTAYAVFQQQKVLSKRNVGDSD
ncbi:unnamed protein product [Leptidea sinapis]|uniref:G-protein coupled receptors family 2 profile 1 domain-containing protein n=1 Tax=Leptidea sinapis TaxID=189913 RepID=A0A5E4QUM5_9NEOP|nr:unnamed protein product [Leptidea sinapis]